MRILLADDHAMVRDGLRPFLHDLGTGIEIHDAGTFGETLEILSGVAGIQLLILDLRMPDMDAAHGIRTIRERHPTLPVAILSAVSDRTLILNTLALGVAGFIPKRLSARAVVSALRLIIAGERYVPAALIENGADHGGGWGRPDGDGDSPGLTGREREILGLLREGLSNKLIARRLNVSEVTVKSHLCHVFRKLGVQNRVQAARFSAGF